MINIIRRNWKYIFATANWKVNQILHSVTIIASWSGSIIVNLSILNHDEKKKGKIHETLKIKEHNQKTKF